MFRSFPYLHDDLIIPFLVCSMQLFLLRAAGFLLPCYIMAWAISILQRLRERQVGVELLSTCKIQPYATMKDAWLLALDTII